MIANRVPLLSPEEYLEWEEKSEIKHEYIDGEVFAMAGSSGKHALLVKNFILTVGPHLRGSGSDLYPQDVKAKVSHRSRFYYPDLMVTCDDRDKPDDYVKRHYKMIVEVLSDSTESFDRGNKFEDYRRSESLEEYVLVSQHRMRVEVYRKNVAGRWELQAYYSGDRVELVSLGLEFAIEDLYDDVTLPPEKEEETEEVADDRQDKN